ncbi:MAG: hypothetical protein AVDCRST_MAG56-5803, partial [uncultured Cytophagales bacterium]
EVCATPGTVPPPQTPFVVAPVVRCRKRRAGRGGPAPGGGAIAHGGQLADGPLHRHPGFGGPGRGGDRVPGRAPTAGPGQVRGVAGAVGRLPAGDALGRVAVGAAVGRGGGLPRAHPPGAPLAAQRAGKGQYPQNGPPGAHLGADARPGGGAGGSQRAAPGVARVAAHPVGGRGGRAAAGTGVVGV